MTDEEKAEAEEYIDSIKPKRLDEKMCLTVSNFFKAVKYGYMCGLERGEKIGRENAEQKEQIEQLSQRILEQQKTIGSLTDTIDEMKAHCKAVDDVNEKMKYCANCKNCEVNFTNDSGIKYRCKKLRHKSDDCILNDYHYWELAE